MSFRKDQIVSLIDWTNLNSSLSQDILKSFCLASNTLYGNVAGVCIQSKYIQKAKDYIPENINIVTVVNFPYGKDDIQKVVEDASLAIIHGANEIDVVIPYHEYSENGTSINTLALLSQLRSICSGDIKLKAIIEVHGLINHKLIAVASKDAISCNVDFIKTSTGKISGTVTKDIIQSITNTMKDASYAVGIKISVGIKTEKEAAQLLAIITNEMGEAYLTPELCRIGASRPIWE